MNAYADKLDGKIPQDFWERKMSDWRMEKQQVREAAACPHLTKRASVQGMFPATQENPSKTAHTSQSPKSRLNLYRLNTLGTLVSPHGEGYLLRPQLVGAEGFEPPALWSQRRLQIIGQVCRHSHMRWIYGKCTKTVQPPQAPRNRYSLHQALQTHVDCQR
jgi:hypothetical protein